MNIELSLNQGKKYNQYQNRIKKGLEKKERFYKNKNKNKNNKEGFQNVYIDEINNKTTTKQSNSQDSLTLQNLVSQYNTLAAEYIAASKEATSELSQVLDREGPNNPYKGTNIYFSDNASTGYVTELGNYKLYTADSYQNTAGKNGCPLNYNTVSVDNSSNVNSPGSILDTSPSLLVGQPIVSGQSCGNEGQNVYVNSMTTNPTISYIGCYNQNAAIDNTEYLGNGDFTFPKIPNDSYQYVPGVLNPLPWIPFYATLVNNSSVMQVPMPYPAGSQCCLIENLMNISQTINNLPAGTYTCSLWIAGRNFQNGPNPIEFLVDNISIYTFTPGYNWEFIQVDFTVNETGSHTVMFIGNNDNNSSGDYGSFIQGVSIKEKTYASPGAMEQVNLPYGNFMSFESCQLFAQNSGYPYFGLSNTQSDGTGTCMVSSNLSQAQQYGTSVDMNPASIWNSGAQGFKLQVNGLQLVLYTLDIHYVEEVAAKWPDTVNPDCVGNGMINNISATWGSNCPNVAPGNATNGVISAIANSGNNYQTAYTVGTGMGSVTYPDTYSYNLIGTANDVCSGGPGYVGVPGYPYWTQQTQADCETTCTNDPNCSSYDMVPNGQNNGTNQCAFFSKANNVIPASWGSGSGLGCYEKVEQTQSGTDPAPGCAKDFDITYQCGNTVKTGNIPGEANGKSFIVDCSAEQVACATFLIVQDDGNVVLYQGTPGGQQTGLWSTGTQNVSRSPNPDWEATKGKYGRNYLVVGEYLLQNEWVGSNDGSIRLQMQTDGYASLVINNTSGDCVSIGSNYGGGPKSNAIYQQNPVGNKSLIGKVAYIDKDSVLREFPSSMIGLSTEYDVMKNTNSWGNNLGIAPISNSNTTSCKLACDDNDSCHGYVFDNTNNNCWLKNSSVYPQGPYINEQQGMDLYTRKPEVFSNYSCNKAMNPINSIQYENYIKGNAMTNSDTCGVNINNQNLINIENQLADLAEQISQQINTLENDSININNEMKQDDITLHQDLKEYRKIQRKIGNFSKQNPIEKNNMTSNSMKEGLLNMDDINAMVTNSDLLVLQNNYQYIFWTILAVGAIIVTLNLLKK